MAQCNHLKCKFHLTGSEVASDGSTRCPETKNQSTKVPLLLYRTYHSVCVRGGWESFTGGGTGRRINVEGFQVAIKHVYVHLKMYRIQITYIFIYRYIQCKLLNHRFPIAR